MFTISRTYPSPGFLEPVRALFKGICDETQSPLSDKIKSMNDLDLSRLQILPSDYSSADSFRNDYLLTKFLSKWKGLETGIDTAAVALSAFDKQEATCRRSNLRIKSRNTSFVQPLLHKAQRVIASVLGPFSLSRFDGLESWSPGATTDLKKTAAHVDAKMMVFPIPVTRDCLGYLKRSIEADLHWSEIALGHFPVGPFSLLPDNFKIVQGCRLDFVTKDAKTDRTIGIEPRGNMWVQKAAGDLIRKLLRRVGINLNDQGINQNLAYEAIRRKLATIDLKMASDSICLELIYELLPIEWAMFLDSIRSKYYQDGPEGPFRKYAKFSSMGNGFTFELESLIFYALVRATESDDCSDFSDIAVYGDDIIVPQDRAPVLISLLNYCGFEINTSKSYVDGRFFESCGRHYFDGKDVTPVYQKEVVTDYAEHVRLLNRVARYLVRNVDEQGDNIALVPGFKAWHNMLRFGICPYTPLLPMGAEGDDGYLHLYSMQTLYREKRSYGRQWLVSVQEVPKIPGYAPALYAYQLRQTSLRTNPLSNYAFSGFDAPYAPVDTPGNRRNSEDLDSREAAVVWSTTTRWIEPSWEYFITH